MTEAQAQPEIAMTQPTTLPKTQNPGWGFWGTMEQHAEPGWAMALPAVAQATAASLEAARAFLDSTAGRHFADEVLRRMQRGVSLQVAIEETLDQWMSWRIGRQTGRTYGIPVGLPYLTGFVTRCEILLDEDRDAFSAGACA